MKYTSVQDVKERLLSKIVVISECWVWQGAKNNYGYGLIKITNFNGVVGRNTCYAHRMSYLCFNGELDEGKLVCHTCDNPLCINPKHLFLGSHQDNMDDMHIKGRNGFGRNYGNSYAGKKVIAEGKVYNSYSEAGRDIGVSDNTIRKRINRGVEGYEEFEESVVCDDCENMVV